MKYYLTQNPKIHVISCRLSEAELIRLQAKIPATMTIADYIRSEVLK